MTTVQPDPVPNDGPVVHAAVRADLEARQRLGTATYGTPLQPHNGRDALMDAYQKALDLACYLKQALMERDAASSVGVAVWQAMTREDER